MKKITVIFSSDNNYAMPTGVAITSLLHNARQDTVYEIIILVDLFFSEKNKRLILSLKNIYSNHNIKFIIVNKSIEVEMIWPHISKVTYFRFYIPVLLPNHDKVIYLDSDIIVNNDLTELWNTELDDNYLAAVAEPTLPPRRLPSPYNFKNYFNAGILLINLKKWREDDLNNKAINMISDNYEYQDQDILNILASGKTVFLPLKFNFCPRHNYKANSYIYNESKEVLDNFIICHFLYKYKPWNSYWILKKYGKKWKKYFKISPFKNQKLYFREMTCAFLIETIKYKTIFFYKILSDKF